MEIQFSSDISHDTSVQFNSVQSLSHVQLFVTQWVAARQASLSITNSQSLFKLMSIESVMPSNHLILSSVIPFSSCLQSFPASGSFPVSRLFTSGGQSIGASASASVLPVNIQGRFPLGLTGLISLLSKGLSSLLQHHSSKASILQHSAFSMVQFSHPYMTTEKTVALTMNLCQQSDVCFLIHCLGLSWLFFQGGSVLWPHHILITSSEILFPNTASWALGLQRMNLGGESTSIQATTPSCFQ